MANPTFPFASVQWPLGADNMGGLSVRVFLTPAKAVKAMPGFAPDSDTVRNQDGWVMQEGGKWLELYATFESTGVKASVQGGNDCHSYKLSGELFHPGETKAMAALARAINNTPCLFAIPDNAGNLRLIGTLDHPCAVSVSHDTGKKAADSKGWTVKFETSAVASHVFLEGAGADLPMD